MADILDNVDVHVRCERCGDYVISARVIADSQKLTAEGCPGSLYECPAGHFATLLDGGALASLKRAWHDLERSAQMETHEVSVRGRAKIEISWTSESTAVRRGDSRISIENGKC